MDFHKARTERQNWLQRFFKRPWAHRTAEIFLELSGPFARHGRRAVTEHHLVLQNLPQKFSGYRIAHLTDLHTGRALSGRRLDRLVEDVNALRPDVILLTGDYLSWGTRYLQTCAEAAGRLQAPDGVYAVLGNHDYFIDAERIVSVLKEKGVIWLTNKNTLLQRGEETIVLVGLDDHQLGRPDIKAALSGVPDGKTRILLMHNPVGIEEDIGGYRFDLILSGHTHGGQAVLPLIGAPVMPGHHTRPYREGWFHLKDSPLYVSRGIGLSMMMPFRLNCPPEIALFVLEQSNA